MKIGAFRELEREVKANGEDTQRKAKETDFEKMKEMLRTAAEQPALRRGRVILGGLSRRRSAFSPCVFKRMFFRFHLVCTQRIGLN